jgi:hypothetical protein
MGKRSNFERVPRDYYPTPFKAVLPLKEHLGEKFVFIEPCAGNGALISHLQMLGGSCVDYYDIEPQTETVNRLTIFQGDALEKKPSKRLIITNPPWDRKILHPMIKHFMQGDGCWLLFDADWAHTVQSSELMKYCKKIVSVGRVKWIPDSKATGKDNCAWYFFSEGEGVTEFYGRVSK